MEGLIGMAGGGDDGDSLPSYTQLERAHSQDINYEDSLHPPPWNPEPIFSSADDGPLLPDPVHMRPAAFCEWRRQNAIYLEDKEKEEKELRNQVIAEADEFKQAFIDKRKKNIENNTALNLEYEKLYLKNQEKFHKEADKQFWKVIAELIPREVANIDTRRAKKEKEEEEEQEEQEEEEKKPGIVVIQGLKPGKPTDLSRMRQLLMKLKENPPPHMIPPETDTKDQSSKQNPEEAKPNA